jgi:hypothetical protein
MSATSGLLQATFGIVALTVVWRFDLRERFETVEPIGSVKFDPGVAIFTGAVALVVFGFASAAWSVIG